MTYDEMQKLNRGETVTPQSLAFPKFDAKLSLTPINEFNESAPRPLADGDYNHVALSQVESLHQFDGMDALHKLDALGNDFNRAQALETIKKGDIALHGEKLGKQKFVDRYKKPKN